MIRNVIMTALILVLAGFVATGFAYNGFGKGGGCGATNSSSCPVSGSGSVLSDEDIKTLTDAKNTFLEETSEVREQAYQKQLELRDALNVDSPDMEMVSEIQADLSEMIGQIAQARLRYQIATKGITSSYGSGCGNASAGCSAQTRGCGRVIQ